MKIAIQGIEGSFHHRAAEKYFGAGVDVVPHLTFDALFKAMRSDYDLIAGLVAVENSIAGKVETNNERVRSPDFSIIGELNLPIHHHLMALSGQSMGDIREVHSQAIALKQCLEFLNRFPFWQLIETEDTALSAKNIHVQNAMGIAAVAGELAAELYQLDILAHDIHSEKNNFTRFLIFTKKNK